MTRARRALLWIGILALPVVGSAVFVAPRLAAEHSSDANLQSIKSTPEYQEPALLDQAWALPVAALYKADIVYQSNASVCGPTSMVNVLHSLQQPANQGNILQGTGFTTVLGYLPQGITLDQLSDLAKLKLDWKVSVLRGLDLAEFRNQLRHVNEPSRRYVINFSRRPLFGTGGGHHSPIAGYLIDQDLVLVLDVNKNYGPWLVKPERLYEAMNTVDSTTGKKRGLLLLEKK
jgi:hypothetical protein